jgi:hypothetical protein
MPPDQEKNPVKVFGSDWGTLAQLLPNIKAIPPHSEQSVDDDGEELDNQMNVP